MVTKKKKNKRRVCRIFLQNSLNSVKICWSSTTNIIPCNCLWCNGQVLPIIGTSPSHSVAFLWTSDRPETEIPTQQHYKTHKRKTSIFPAGLEPAIPGSKRPQTHILGSFSRVAVSTSVRCYFSSAAVKVMALLAAGVSVSLRLVAAVFCCAAGK